MGGMEIYSVRLAEELAKSCNLDLHVLRGSSSGRKPGAARLIGFGLVSAWRLLRASPADVIHVADAASWPLGWIASLRHPTSRLVLSAHGSDISYANRTGLRAWLYRAYLRLGARMVGQSLLIANSRWIERLAQDHGFRRTTVVYLGATIAPPPNKADIGHNGCLFFAGRIVRRKGLSAFVREVLPLLTNPPTIRVAGAIGDDEEAAILASRLVDYVGILEPDQLAKEYAAAICVIVPSIEPEGFGLVAAEATAAGGVVVASAHSGLLEALENGAGFTADPGDPAKWAEIIGRIRGWSPEERARFLAAHKRDPLYFSWKRTADETIAAYALGR